MLAKHFSNFGRYYGRVLIARWSLQRRLKARQELLARLETVLHFHRKRPGKKNGC